METAQRENTRELRQGLKNALDRILDSYRRTNRKEVKLCVLSALCDETKRLVAEEILGLSEGSTLKAILPLTNSDCLEHLHGVLP